MTWEDMGRSSPWDNADHRVRRLSHDTSDVLDLFHHHLGRTCLPAERAFGHDQAVLRRPLKEPLSAFLTRFDGSLGFLL